MTGRIVVTELGGPEVLAWQEVGTAAPGPGEVRLLHKAVGLNFIDVYHRTGLYPGPTCPFVLGMEGAGVVDMVGPDVKELTKGDRVAYAGGPMGSYATDRIFSADRLVKIPEGISDDVAAATMLKGMTAEYLLFRTFKVEAGQTIVVHAAAGGVGLILCQWAKELGATVIGTVGSEDKARLASENGCDHPIIYTREKVVDRVRSLTRGQGVPVVYDSVGKDTMNDSLDCLSPLGMLVLFGQSSGKVPPFDLGILASKGSLFVTRPTMMTYTASREDLVLSSQRVFAALAQKKIRPHIGQSFPLKSAADAHRALEARQTTGSTLLVP